MGEVAGAGHPTRDGAAQAHQHPGGLAPLGPAARPIDATTAGTSRRRSSSAADGVNSAKRGTSAQATRAWRRASMRPGVPRAPQVSGPARVEAMMSTPAASEAAALDAWARPVMSACTPGARGPRAGSCSTTRARRSGWAIASAVSTVAPPLTPIADARSMPRPSSSSRMSSACSRVEGMGMSAGLRP